jgi:hypothetical protein
VAHSCGIARISLRSLALSEGTMRSCMSFCLLQSLTSSCRSFLTYYNISRNINWSYGMNGISRLNYLPVNCWRVRERMNHLLFFLTINIHRSSRSHECYLLLKGNISAHLNLSLTRDVDPVCLRRLTVPHKCTLSS